MSNTPIFDQLSAEYLSVKGRNISWAMGKPGKPNPRVVHAIVPTNLFKKNERTELDNITE